MQCCIVSPADACCTTFNAGYLGYCDDTAIWLIQVMGESIHWLDYYAANQQPLAHYAEKLKEWRVKHGIRYTAHLLPHDAARRDAHGISYVENLAKQGIYSVRVVPRTMDIWAGINTLRELLMRSFFHLRTQQRTRNWRGVEEPGGVERLELYRSRPPGRDGAQAEMPVHDGNSHTADAARTFAEAWSHGLLYADDLKKQRPKRARMK